MNSLPGPRPTLAGLPDDIICELFKALETLDAPHGPLYRRSSRLAHLEFEHGQRGPSLGWIKLTHICRRLRNIGIGYLPALWGRVVCVFPNAHAWKTILARSRSAPLVLDIRDPGLRAAISWPLPAHALARARAISDIIHSEHPLSRRWWTDATLPSLEFIELSNDSELGTHRPSHCTGHICAPKLLTYTISGGFVPFHAQSLRSLLVGHQVLWTKLLDSLRSCPLLETLIVFNTCEPSDLTPVVVEVPVLLPCLKYFELVLPSDDSVCKLIDSLCIPLTTKVQCLYCRSPAVFRQLLSHRQLRNKPAFSDMLRVSAMRCPTAGTRSLSLVVAEFRTRESTSYKDFLIRNACADFRLVMREEPGVVDAADLAGMIEDAFSPSAALDIRVLAFHEDLDRIDSVSPIPNSLDGRERFGAALQAFAGVTILYVQRQSIQILELLRISLERVEIGSNVDALFPELQTIVLDITTERLKESQWRVVTDLLSFRWTGGRPLERLVLMGTHLCHMSPDRNPGVTKLRISLGPVKWARLPTCGEANGDLLVKYPTFYATPDSPNDIICELFKALATIDAPRGLPLRRSLNPAYLEFEYGKPSPSLGWIILTHICRRLRNIGIGYLPALWGRVVCVFPSAHAWKTTLARSRSAPLVLDTRDAGVRAVMSWPLPAHAMVRARSIRGVVHPQQPVGHQWWSDANLPSCKFLDLSYDYGIGSRAGSRRLELTGHISAPVLVNYEIRGGFIPFHAQSLQCLSVSYSVVWTMLLDCLQSCPLLESLTVLDTCESSEPESAPEKATATALPRLKRISLSEPSDDSVCKLLDHLIIPLEAKVDGPWCRSPTVFRHLLTLRKLRSDPASHDMLRVSATRCPTDGTRYLSLAVSEYWRGEETPYIWLAFTELGLSRREQPGDTAELVGLLEDAFSPSAALDIRVLVFHDRDNCGRIVGVGSLPNSPDGLERLGVALRAFAGVVLLHVQRQSIPVLELLRASLERAEEADSNTEALFPELQTIVLNIVAERLEESQWRVVMDILAHRKASGRPVARLVLMGTHLCHMSPDRDPGVTKLRIAIGPAKKLVGEVVDLRGGKRCTCGKYC
ncbi:hypothetical protein PENSPDRAFT_736015 [Peniophora sp. CONT]|nr:hypothetical protein PENSPDRAFT_736015 [Peniophora sp. CONT]